MKKYLIMLIQFFSVTSFSQKMLTAFEKSNGTETAEYTGAIHFYEQLASKYSNVIHIKNFDSADAGYPLQLVMYSSSKNFSPADAHKKGNVVILVNNGIHPGEPDGIDASMMLMRDIATGKIQVPANIFLAVIPVYNIGGSLNRGTTRVNQDGPLAYGFRGNSQNLDLNRDFIKCDSKEALTFTKIFHWLNPHILIDTHVSDGADYQHVFTVVTTSYNKLGGPIGAFLHNSFEPALFKSMHDKNIEAIPYVNTEDDPAEGWTGFYESPRYSSGYAALFQTMSFMSETHMLKPFKERVLSTYSFLQSAIEVASIHAKDIISKRQQSIEEVQRQKIFATSWQPDSTTFDLVNFSGYTAAEKPSDVTGASRVYYDHTKPYTKQIKFYNAYKPVATIQKPAAYIIPQGWHQVMHLLKINGVQIKQLTKDTVMQLEYYHIENYKSAARPFEKHHLNYNTELKTMNDKISLRKGDYIIYTGQPADRYIVEVLEPQMDDSFFSWNFFDAVLQQKEWYSNYRWEDAAAQYLQQNTTLKKQLDEKKKNDAAFAASADQQLYFVYKNSPWFEKEYMRYPAYRLIR